MDFDFDINFIVESFVLSFTIPGKLMIVERVSKSDKFTADQINNIKLLVIDQKVTIEAITIRGPDGKKRQQNPMVFTITNEKSNFKTTAKFPKE